MKSQIENSFPLHRFLFYGWNSFSSADVFLWSSVIGRLKTVLKYAADLTHFCIYAELKSSVCGRLKNRCLKPFLLQVSVNWSVQPTCLCYQSPIVFQRSRTERESEAISFLRWNSCQKSEFRSKTIFQLGLHFNIASSLDF